MYKIEFFREENGSQPVRDYLNELSGRKDKDSRIKSNKAAEYLFALKTYGTSAGEPYVKHLDGEIWELRPIRDRILFFGEDGGTFVLLHQFTKKTQKTPKKEIERAKRNMNTHMNRKGNKHE
ncbi:hypothetical protein FACS189499_06500 [Clostridia bacterium]|nr:hypothetical protein FACS189499_06500 [Clostridia bacterium]